MGSDAKLFISVVVAKLHEEIGVQSSHTICNTARTSLQGWGALHGPRRDAIPQLGGSSTSSVHTSQLYLVSFNDVYRIASLGPPSLRIPLNVYRTLGDRK